MTILRLLKRVSFIGTVLCATLVFPQRSLADEDKPMQQPYFYLTKETKNNQSNKRCFMVTVGRPLEENGKLGPSSFHVHYELRVKEGNPEAATVSLELSPLAGTANRNPKPLKVEQIGPGEGSLGFNTKNAGKYSLCAVFNTINSGDRVQLFLDVDVGLSDEDLKEIKKAESLDDLQIHVVKLRSTAKLMLNKADFIKNDEIQHHGNLVRLNREVTEWPVVQVLILLAAGFYQVRHLKQFFKAKRLV